MNRHQVIEWNPSELSGQSDISRLRSTAEDR